MRATKALLISFLFVSLLVFGACTQGQRDSMTSAVTGVVVKEVETDNLQCGVAQFNMNISVSCVPKVNQ